VIAPRQVVEPFTRTSITDFCQCLRLNVEHTLIIQAFNRNLFDSAPDARLTTLSVADQTT
jgi:hypothetical protein